MRATVLLSELAIYIPAVISFVRWTSKKQGVSPISQSLASAAILFQPALILIDHGHFQYNSVMLGLALFSIVNLQNNNNLTACFCFISSIMFKQMALYYSPAIFAYLLGVCFFPRINIYKLAAIATSTIFSLFLTIAPIFVLGGFSTVQQMVIRIFPFSRGLWEDKVANFWCTANTFIKFKFIFSNDQLQKLSLLVTILAISPTMIIAFLYPKRQLLPWIFSSCSWAFFLFSFQVHEKSVLLPLMPTTLLIAVAIPKSTSNKNNKTKFLNSDDLLPLVFWINNVAMFSLWPLLKREGLQFEFFTMTLCWNWLIGNFNFLTSLSSEYKLRTHLLPSTGFFWKYVLILTYSSMLVFHIVEFFIPPPSTYPDLFVLSNITISCGCFGLFWLYTLYQLFVLRDINDDDNDNDEKRK